MNTLLDTVHWESKEHPGMSRGQLASLAPQARAVFAARGSLKFPEDFNFQVMTRRQRVLFANMSRTTVLCPDLPGQGGMLWWNTGDEAILALLHRKCVSVAQEVGFSEFCVMCAAHGPSAEPYWREMLGEDFRCLKRWQ